jgi:hypothetical protein
MKSLLTLTLLAGLAFAQAAPAPKTEKPKEEAKSGCCGGSGSGCCGSMDKDKKDAKKGGCCGSGEGSMCKREPIKDKESKPGTDTPKK